MKSLFVDTSAWVAIVNRRDQYHTIASEFYRKSFKEYDRLLTTNLVAAESFILLRLDCGLDIALSWWDRITTSLKVEMIYIDAELTSGAFNYLRKFKDQRFSLTDAVSFTVMEQKNIQEAFAFDVHFSVAGFIKFP
jgi:predicted nucleic acid-binding protein